MLRRIETLPIHSPVQLSHDSWEDPALHSEDKKKKQNSHTSLKVEWEVTKAVVIKMQKLPV